MKTIKVKLVNEYGGKYYKPLNSSALFEHFADGHLAIRPCKLSDVAVADAHGYKLKVVES